MTRCEWGLDVSHREMLDKLLEFAEESQLRVLEIDFVTKKAWVLDDALEREVQVEYEQGEWF